MASTGFRAVSPLREGQMLFGRYRLVRELGRGGMGLVLRATDTELGVDMALKLVPDLLIHDEDALHDLRQEVLRGMTLTHPCIVRTHGLVRDEAMAAIVMEYVDGGTFHDLRKLQPAGCFDPDDLLPWLEQLCPALDYAHFEIQLAHRDLKPRNLMYTHTGRIKVADFGISSNIEDSMTRMTAARVSSGTPSYMSPQQVMGERPSHLDDIYALGATLYELLTGKPPFHQGDVLYQVLEKEAPTLRRMRAELGVSGKAEIPDQWERAIAACLAKSPAARPPSAGDVVRALSSGDPVVVTSGGPDKDPPAEETPRAKRPKKKRGSGRTVAAVLGVLAVAAGAVYVATRQPEPRAIPEPGPLVIRIPDPLPSAVAGSSYRLQLEAGGGSPPYTWAPDGDGLPAGLALDKNGLLHGTPQAPAELTLGFVVTDSAAAEAGKHAFLVITPPATGPREVVEEPPEPLRWITPSELPSGMVGVPYRLSLAAEGGTPPYSWKPVSGTPPPGISLAEDGTLSGMPEQPFSGGFAVRLADGDGAQLDRSFGLTILPRPNDGPVAEDDDGPVIRASKTRPFVNSLGMSFVPAGTERVLFCTHLTRVKDFRSFSDEAAPDMSGMVVGIEKGGNAKFKRMPFDWENPGFAQTDEHPVCAVSWQDAMKFCDWLTNRELQDETIPPGFRYRLPLDKEWRGALAGTESSRFPWGNGNPPNFQCNLAGAEIRNGEIPERWKIYEGFRDNAPFPSPVGHFPANRYGLHDIYGNLWQFCMDVTDASSDKRLLRGGSWLTHDPNELALDESFDRIASIRSVDAGFRCVLAPISPNKP